MKKLIILIFLIWGCEPQPEGGSQKRKSGDYSIKVIDSCEYIEFDRGILDQRVYSLTHKGNCKYCEKRRLTN